MTDTIGLFSQFSSSPPPLYSLISSGLIEMQECISLSFSSICKSHQDCGCGFEILIIFLIISSFPTRTETMQSGVLVFHHLVLRSDDTLVLVTPQLC